MIFSPLASSSHGNAYLLDDGNTRILIECGVPYRRLQKMLGFNMSAIDACLISHEHKDHSCCYKDMIKNGVPVFASEGTAEALDCDLIDAVEERKVFSIGSMEILPFATFHDAAEPFGFLIRSRVDGEKLMFATDTVNLGYRFLGVNIVAIEANYDAEILERFTRMPEKVRHRIENSHMEIDRTCAYLQKLDKSALRRVYLMHLSDACSNEYMFEYRAQRVCPGVEIIVCPKEATRS